MFRRRSVTNANDARRRVALAGKKPLIELTAHPANYETPLDYFHDPITSNEAFYVRSHGVPPEISRRAWLLGVGGDAAQRSFSLSLAALKAMPAHEVTAVCYCAGNRRRYFNGDVPGVQWGDGGMGCARWKGARLRDVLSKAGPTADAVELVLHGADKPATDVDVPFVKCLPIAKAMDERVLLAYEMNGVPLPLHHGAPVRLVVPGWTATYWVKHLSGLTLTTEPFNGHWMSTDYRVPSDKFGVIEHFATQKSEFTDAITEIQVNSLIGDARRTRRGVEVSGLAWDAGYGIANVSLTADGGASWSRATLDPALGPFAYRPWRCIIRDVRRGEITVMARATGVTGQTQPLEPVPNPSGYYYNAMPRVVLPA